MKQEEIFESDEEIKAELVQVTSKLGRIELKKRFTDIDGTSEGKVVAKSFKLWWAIAAIGAILIASVLFLRPSSPDALYAANYSKFPNSSVAITRGDGGDADLKRAMIPYMKGDYELAVEKLNLIEEDFPEVKIYNGIIAMENKDFETATSILEPLSRDSNYKFRDEAKWYLGLAYLKIDLKDKAKMIFQDLSAGASDFTEKSAKLLKKL